MKKGPKTVPNVMGHVQTWEDISQGEMAGAVLSKILVHFQFDVMGVDEPVRQPFDLEDAIRQWSENVSTKSGLVYGQLILEQKKSPHAGFMVNWQRQPAGLWLNSISLSADPEYFPDKGRLERFLDLIEAIFSLVRAGYGTVSDSLEWDEKAWVDETLPDGRRAEVSVSLKAQEGLVDLYWANLFGPPYVRRFGADRIESCPGVAVRKIGPEAYRLLTAPTPFQWSDPSVRAACESAKRHLDPTIFVDKAHPDRKPAPPDWRLDKP